MTTDERQDILKQWDEAVNMTTRQLEEHLASQASQEVGQKPTEGAESAGHASGRRIVELLGKKRSELTEDDLHHMKRVVGYVHRHLAQRPGGDVHDTRWRYSLMNWGHDPEKR